MINNFCPEDFYAFSSDVAGACTYGSDDNLPSRMEDDQRVIIKFLWNDGADARQIVKILQE
jgi:hypothetical protein